jgi:hypothetical protein
MFFKRYFISKVSFYIIFSYLIFSAFFSAFSQNRITLSENFPFASPSDYLIKFHFDRQQQIPEFKINNNSQQDPGKGFLPFLFKSFPSSLPLKLKNLKNIRYIIANEEQKQFILQHFGHLITSEFETVSVFDFSNGNGMFKIKIYAFRKTQNEIHILFDADIEHEIDNQTSVYKSYATQNTSLSVLSSGTWFKLAVTQSGVHRMNKNIFDALGINTSTLNPKNIRIYGTNASFLPEKNNVPRPDDLTEIPIYVEGESDNQFDANDYVLFYAKGLAEWKYNANNTYTYQSNLYSDTNYYFLNVDLGPGLRISSVNHQSLTPNVSTSSYDYIAFHEKDNVNFLKSGREFYGEYFDFVTSYGFSFNDGNFVVGDTLKVFCSLAGRHSANNIYSINSGTLSNTIFCPGIPISVYSNYAIIGSRWTIGLNTMPNIITVNVTKNTAQAVAWLDKIIINARRNLVYNNRPFQFRDARVTGSGNVCTYSVQSLQSNIRIWNVTDPIVPKEIQSLQSGTFFMFNYPSDMLEEFFVFRTQDLPSPIAYGRVPNQNLHAISNVEYLIITHPKFLSQSQEIAQLHIQKDNLSTQVVTTAQIYNEFSSGRPEATAIRDFIRMVYLRGLSLPNKLKYVLLMGRGSVFNKNKGAGNTNFIPTYQSWESLNPLGSVTTDDFYALMDPTEGEFAETFGAVDIGIGRIICTTPEEASAVVRKIKTYYQKDGLFEYEQKPGACNEYEYSVMGEWRNHMIFAADDGDNALHMADADDINKYMNQFPEYIIHKIYIDAYQGVSTPGGKRYPDMQNALNDRINRGCLLFNYTGHGGEVGLAAERVVDIPTIQSWKNLKGLPLFITATCEFSRYDDPDRFSAGELCLLNPNGGAIALMTTCRLAFSSTNKQLNQKVLENLMDFSAGRPRLGDILRKSKAALFQSSTYANFHLLGDPAIMLAYPENKIIIDSVRNNIKIPGDTLKGMEKITLTGKILDPSNNQLNSFNGYATVNLYDKKNKVICLLNDPGSSTTNSGPVPFSFFVQNIKLTGTRVKVNNGRFTATFVVPKNLLPAFDKAKISVYATNGTTDAHAGDTTLYIGGISSNPYVDNDGPSIRLFLNDEKFVNGGITNQNPVLIAHITDSSGINISGVGFGNDIKATFNQSDQRVLNSYYVPDVGSHQSGKLRYKIDNLKEGNYSMELKVWDVANNSSTARLDFVVAKDEKLALERVLNYPNPFTTRTEFFFEHNRSCDEIRTTLEIFTISGKSVKKIEKNFYCEGFRSSGILWDGKDDFGSKLARGVYLYKLTIRDSKNEKAEKIEKVVILN